MRTALVEQGPHARRDLPALVARIQTGRAAEMPRGHAHGLGRARPHARRHWPAAVRLRLDRAAGSRAAAGFMRTRLVEQAAHLEALPAGRGSRFKTRGGAVELAAGSMRMGLVEQAARAEALPAGRGSDWTARRGKRRYRIRKFRPSRSWLSART